MTQKSSPHWSRRRFISATASTGIAVAAAPLLSWTRSRTDDRVNRLVAETIGIDTHNHMDVPFTKEAFAESTYDLTGEMKRSGLSAMCMTFCVDRPELTKEGEAYQRFISSIDEMDEMLKANGVQRAFNFADIQAAHKNHKPVVIQSVEGGHFIEGKLERISTAYNRGLRHLGLMHDNQANPPIGDIYTNPSKFSGLTEYGLNIIKECNKLGILIDLAHCNNEAIDDALEVSTRPIIISHTGLNTQLGTNERMAKMMLPRLISKEQAKKVANSGGIIGVWTHLADTPLEFVQNIRALLDAVGTDHVCIGTDTRMAAPANANGRGGMKTNEAWQNQSEGFYYVVVDAMLKAGFNEKEIANIGGGNFCRIFDDATKNKK